VTNILQNYTQETMQQSNDTATQQQQSWKNLIIHVSSLTGLHISYLLGSRQHNAHGILTEELQHWCPLLMFSLEQIKVSRGTVPCVRC